MSVRVLHVTPYFAPAFVYGGPPRSVLGLCLGLQRAGAQVAVVTTTANGDTELPDDAAARSSVDGVPVVYLHRTFPRRHFRASGLRTWLAAHRRDFDLVHIHGCWNFFGRSAARWCRIAGLPYVLSPRGMLHPWSFAQGRLRKAIAYRLVELKTLRAARFIHTTSDEESRVVSALGVAADIVMIPNGVDAAAPVPAVSVEQFRQRLGASPGDFMLLFLGRLHPKKGIDRLIAAFRQALKTVPNLYLVFAGSGDAEYLRHLRETTRDLEQPRRIAFAGFIDGDDRRFALASADAFVLTSHSENFGMGVAEAMAAGLPVIVSRECPWGQIEEWRAGCWVDNTPAAIAAAIEALASDPAAARGMGENGRRGVARSLDWKTLAAAMLGAYREALAPN
jgi:glycosyltransferase involved in cell wall biosynthesis